MRADLAIVGEATRLEVVTAHKGALWLELETRGKAAHGSCPELGRNAVHAMARIVDLLQTTYAAELRRRRHPLLGCGTVSVGAICGGTQANIVPDRCTILIDRRTLPGETEAGVQREFMAVLRRQKLKAAFVKRDLPAALPLETDPKLPLVARFLRSVGQRRPVGVRYFCDASVLGRGGIPSVVFGPGDIAQAHTADEWVSVEALERGKRLLRRFLESFS
jgi:acetylornithine deacetylase/succinyl-diaminopimelate desuccinylase-like protein